MKTYVCKKIKLYEYLTNKGYKPYRVATDIYNAERKVWLYDDSDNLRKDIDNYYKMRS